MAETANSIEFDVPKELLNKLTSSKEAFKAVLTGKIDKNEKSKEPPVNLVLEKMADNVVKIFATLQMLELNSLNTTSENSKSENDVSSSSQQTDRTGTSNSLMQTDKKAERDQKQQTEKKSYAESSFQTTKTLLSDSSIQTSDVNTLEFGSQTEIKTYKATPCQTTVKSFQSSLSQTVVKQYNDTLCQTLLSVANLRDSECQATVSTRSVGYQAHVAQSTCEVQATVTNADDVTQTEINCSDGSMQTERNEAASDCQTDLSMLAMLDNTSQTHVDTTSCDAQTDSSFAFMGEFGCQMSPDMTEYATQTMEKSLREMPCQTEIFVQFVETQTTPDISNHETQTDEVKPQLLPSNSDVTAAAPDQLDAGLLAPPQLESVPLDGDLILPSADIQSITRLDAPSLDQQQLPPHSNEMSVQTDPVTIIIGDASFLVEKLKGGPAVKSEKRQREFEIELEENGSTETVKRSRTGYIPGAGLNHNNYTGGTPPFKGRIPLDKLKSTPVVPFNPKASESIRLLRGDVFNTTDQLPIVSEDPVPPEVVMDREPPVVSSNESSVSQVMSQATRTLEMNDEPVQEPKLALSCPFCESQFYEAPELYQHITEQHNERRQDAHHQPKGRSTAVSPRATTTSPRQASTPASTERRFTPSNIDEDEMPDYVKASVQYYRELALSEGKLPPGPKPRKVPRKEVTSNRRVKASQSSPAQEAHRKFQADRSTTSTSSSSSYNAPPVLEPVYLVDTDGHQQFKPSSSTKTYKRAAPKVQAEPNLFEDLPEPKRAFPRGRVRREEPAAQTAAQLDAYEYECPHCPERYGSASHLYSHLKRSHRRQLDEQRGGAGHLSEEDEDNDAAAAAEQEQDAEQQVQDEQPLKNEKDATEEEEEPNAVEEAAADTGDVNQTAEGESTEQPQAEAVAEEEAAAAGDKEATEEAADEATEETTEEAVADEHAAEADDADVCGDVAAEVGNGDVTSTAAGKRKRRSSASTPRGKKKRSESAEDEQPEEEMTSGDEQQRKKRPTRSKREPSATPPAVTKISRTRKPRIPFE